MTITITNADESLLDLLLSINKKFAKPYKISCNKKPSKELLKAIEEAKEIEQNPKLYKSYNNAKELFTDCLNG